MERIFNNEKNAFKCNISISYVLFQTIYDDHNYKVGKPIPVIGHQIRYFYSSMGNNAMFAHPVEIHDRNTLNKFIHNSVINISTLK